MGDAVVRLEGAVMTAHVLLVGKHVAQLEVPAILDGNVVEMVVFRDPPSAARVTATTAMPVISVAGLDIAFYLAANAAKITEHAALDTDV